MNEPVNANSLNKYEIGEYHIGQVEQDLADFQQRLKQAFHVLDSLSKVQQKFEDLTQTYQKFHSYTEEARVALAGLTQIQGSSHLRVGELEKNLELTGREIRSQLLEMQTELREGDRSLKTELMSQINGLKSDLEQDRGESERNKAAFQEDWERQREVVRNQLEKLRELLTNELRTLNNRFDDVHSSTHNNGRQLERLEKLEASFRKTKAAFHDTDQRVGTLRSLAILAIFTGFLGLCVGGFSFLIAYNRSASPTPPGAVRLEP